MPITKHVQGKNECCPFRNKHSEKIWRHRLQDQYQMVCFIMNLKHSIHRRSIKIWFFIYSMESIHHHNYKQDSRDSTWTSYTERITSTIHLVKIKTAITRTSSNYLLAKETWSNLHLKHNLQTGRYSLFWFGQNLYFHSYGCLVSPIPWMKLPFFSKSIVRKISMT